MGLFLSNEISTSKSNLKVVIVGGGVGGFRAAQAIEKIGYSVTVIEPKEQFQLPFASIRASVVPGWENRIFFPYDRFLKKAGSKVIRGYVTKIDKVAKKVTYTMDSKDSIIDYDYLILSPGVGYPSPLTTVNNSVKDTKDTFRAIQSAVAAAKSVAVIGGGATGVEMIGELIENVGAKLHLIHSRASLLDTPATEGVFPQAARDLTRKLLETFAAEKGKNLSLHLSTYADFDKSSTKSLSGNTYISQSNGPVKINLKKGDSVEAIEADVVIYCSGGAPQTKFLKGSDIPLTDHGYIKVNEFYAVEGSDYTIFAYGDATNSKDQNSGYTFTKSSVAIAKNMKALIAAQANGKTAKLVSYPPQTGTALVNFGTQNGIAIINGKTITFKFFIKMKSVDLFTAKMATEFGYKLKELEGFMQ